MSKRFIVDSKNIKKVDNNISIFGDEAHHINVLRYRVKDKVYINEYEVEITEMDKEYVYACIYIYICTLSSPCVYANL